MAGSQLNQHRSPSKTHLKTKIFVENQNFPAKWKFRVKVQRQSRAKPNRLNLSQLALWSGTSRSFQSSPYQEKKKIVKNILLIFYGKLKRVKMRTTRGEEIDAERGGYQNSWTRGWGWDPITFEEVIGPRTW